MAELYRSKADFFNLEVNMLTHDNATAVAAWCEGVEVVEHDAMDYSITFAAINVPTEDGMKRAQEGDWVVKRLIGDFVVVKAAEFYELFEPLT